MRKEFNSDDARTSSSSCRQEINTTTYDDYLQISQTREKWNEEHFALTFPETPRPGKKKRAGPSELQVLVPKQEKRNSEKNQKSTNIWINQWLSEIFVRPPISLGFHIQAPFKYLYNPQNHYIMAETRKPKDDKRRTTLKQNFKEKISSCAISLESKKMITNGKSVITSNTENIPSKSLHKTELFKKPNSTLETNSESNNSKITLKMESGNDKEDSVNSVETNNEATCYKDNQNIDSNNSSDEFSDDISEYTSSSSMDLMCALQEFSTESTDFDEWLTNCSQNNAKKPTKKGKKKDKDSDPDSGDLKDAKKEGKKKEKKDIKKKKDIESTDSGDSKDGKKGPKKDKKDKKEHKKKDTESSDAESGDSKDGKKKKRLKKNVDKKGIESTNPGSLPKGVKKEVRRPKKDDKKNALYTDSESDAEVKKGKKDEKKGNKGRRRKPIRDTESTDADSESEGDPTGKKSEKDKKITKKGEKKDTKKSRESTASDSDYEVRKKKKEVMKGTKKDKRSYSDSASDASPKESTKRDLRPSDSESEGSSGIKVARSTDESDNTSTELKKGPLRGFRSSSKKTTFGEKGKRSATSRIPASRERPLPPCEPLQAPKSKRVCQCKAPPPPPRYAPLPGVEWIHKLL